jgi:hypothetical protein
MLNMIAMIASALWMIRVLTSIAIALCFIGYPFLYLSKSLHSHASVSLASANATL